MIMLTPGEVGSHCYVLTIPSLRAGGSNEGGYHGHNHIAVRVASVV